MADSDDMLRAFGGHPGRRALLQSLLAIGAGGAVLGRFGEALAQASDADVKALHIFSQPGSIPDILNDVTLPMFHKTNPAVDVQLEVASNAAGYPKMLAQRANPAISGGMFNDLFAARGLADKMWTKFDPAFVPNRAHVPEALMTPGGFGIPMFLSPVGIMYNPDRVEKPTSWTDLWNPKYKGRVSMWDAWFDGYVAAAMATGKAPDVAEGIKAWEPYKQNIGVWVNSPTVEEDLVSRGEVWLAPHWGAWCEQARVSGKNVAFTIPKEGGVQWTGHMQVCAGFSPKATELTQRYLDTWISDECQLAWAERGFFSPSVSTVKMPEKFHGNEAQITAADAVVHLVRPDYSKVGAEMPKLIASINRTLKA